LATLTLIRHGQTAWNKARCVQGGKTNTYLNEKGKHQAECLGRRFSTEPVAAIYASPLQRAVDTAEAIAGHHDQLAVAIEPALREVDVGRLEGAPIPEVTAYLDQLNRGEITSKTLFADYDGEALDQLQQKAWRAIQGIVSRHPDGLILVVSHYFVIASILCAALDMPVSQLGRIILRAGSVSTVQMDTSCPRLELLGDNCHITALPK